MTLLLTGLGLAGAIVVLWAVLAGGAAIIRRITGRAAPPRLTGKPEDYASRDQRFARGRWPDDQGR